MSISHEIENLERLLRNGTLSEAEFQQAKHRVLNEQQTQPMAGNNGIYYPPKIHGMAENTWCMFMHLSQLLVFAGGVGIAVPIVMWALSKDENELARQHGARMMNWLISSFIYAIVAGLLCLVLIGFPILIGILILNVVFPIMAALKANERVLWSYPLSIKFIDEH